MNRPIELIPMINESDVLPPAAAWMTPRKSRLLSPRRSIIPEDRILLLYTIAGHLPPIQGLAMKK